MVSNPAILRPRFDSNWVMCLREARPPGIVWTPGPHPDEVAWSMGREARLWLTLDPSDRQRWLTLDLRAYGAPQRVRIHLGATLAGEHVVDATGPSPKLVMLPPMTDGGELEIRLETPDAVPYQHPGAERGGEPVGVELVDAILYDDTDAYLRALQAEFDAALAIRDQLLDRGKDELLDRGELLDMARVTLANLDEVGADLPLLRQRIGDLLADDYVKTRPAFRPTFHNGYFESHTHELRDGRVHDEIRRWATGMIEFKQAVVAAGNRAFPRLEPLSEADDWLAAALERESYDSAEIDQLKEQNELLNDLEILLRRDRLQSIPPAIEIEMTSACNYSCVMCGRSYLTFHFTRQNNSQLAELLPILPFVKHVTVAGVGENTMSDRLGVLATMMQKFRIESRIFTNGSLMHRQLEALAKFTKVCVSFDGACAETFEAQRRGANFELVLNNIRKLRARAPNLCMAFSVVVSRLNFDELPDIVRLAASLGVNHVAFSPVDHLPLLTLKASDQEHCTRMLREADELGRTIGVVVQNNIGPENFSPDDDTPRDKAALLEHFRQVDLPGSHRPPDLTTIEQRVATHRFQYYPAAWVFPERGWPELAKMPEPVAPHVPALRLDLAAERARLDAAVGEALTELRSRPQEGFTIPYCLSVFKYTYTKANGKNRLCPQRNVDVGHLADHGFHEVMNSDMNLLYRSSMFETEALQPLCQVCLDPYRHWGHERMLETCRKLEIRALDLNHTVLGTQVAI